MVLASLRLALRRLFRQPGTTAVHVGGLAVGLACCFLAFLFVRDELSYDRFHEGADRIVSVAQKVQMGDRTMSFAAMPEGGLDALRDGAVGIEAVAATDEQPGLVRTAPKAEGLVVEAIRFADASFFDVFTFPLTRGDARTALDGPNQTVLTASLARSLFGDADPMGRDVYMERTGFGVQDPEPVALTVTGVAADPPTASSLPFELLVSGQTMLDAYGKEVPALDEISQTYVRLASIRDTVAVKAALDPLALSEDNHFAAWGEAFGVVTPRLVDRHLSGSRPRSALVGRPLYLVLFSSVAGLVLLLACVNYANLATALALGRSTEVGVRKTLGAGRGQLARQFLVEAVLLALAAGGVAVALVALALPAFNAFFEKGVALTGLGPEVLALALALAVGTGLLAGAYPAVVLARFRPVTALRGTLSQGRGGRRVRQGLVVFQFAVTAVLLASTAVVAQQLAAARTLDLGFEGDRVVTLDLGAERLRQQRGALKQQVEALPGVTRASLGTATPGARGMSVRVSRWETNNDVSDDLTVDHLAADADYPATLGLTLAAGRWLRPDDQEEHHVVLNETAARAFGLMTTDPATAVGGQIGFGRDDTAFDVIGVVRDYHTVGLRTQIPPLLVQPLMEFSSTLSLSVQLASADARTLDALSGVWEQVAPEYPFAPTFVSEAFAGQLREDRRLGQLFGVFGGIAILIACTGVFGLAAHAAERRTKEIGIRKVLGAGAARLVARLTGEFAALVLVAVAIAVPVSVMLARRWLEDFAYPAPLTVGPFVLVGLGVLVLALLTAGVHAVRAALADPVRALRSE